MRTATPQQRPDELGLTRQLEGGDGERAVLVDPVVLGYGHHSHDVPSNARMLTCMLHQPIGYGRE